MQKKLKMWVHMQDKPTKYYHMPVPDGSICTETRLGETQFNKQFPENAMLMNLIVYYYILNKA